MYVSLMEVYWLLGWGCNSVEQALMFLRCSRLWGNLEITLCSSHAYCQQEALFLVAQGTSLNCDVWCHISSPGDFCCLLFRMKYTFALSRAQKQFLTLHENITRIISKFQIMMCSWHPQSECLDKLNKLFLSSPRHLFTFSVLNNKKQCFEAI